MLKRKLLLITQYCNYAFCILAFGIFAIGCISGIFNVLLSGILLLLFSNIAYGFCDWRKRIVFLIFNFTFFTFLLARPTISMLRGNVWWYFESESIYFSVTVLILSLFFLRIGNALFEHFLFFRHKNGLKPKECVDKSSNESFTETLQIISLIFFAVTIAFYLVTEIEKLVFMQGREYEEIYTSFSSQLPSAIQTIAAMMKYALCIFLATLPSKRRAFIPLAMYVISGLPDLIIGIRNTIVLNVIFVLLYYLLRDILEKHSIWFSKTEKILVVLLCPIALLFLSAYNYIRAGETVSLGVWDSIVDLFYKQGVSYDVLCMAYEALPDLPDVVSKNYTFGPFIDYITRGSLGQLLFDSLPLGSQNSEILAIYGNSFAHSMSYVAHPEYLQGHGWGSSYILELFADWGYLGVSFGSLLLGGVLSWMVYSFKKSTMTRIIILLCSTQIFFCPRSGALSWISFIITLQFWIAVAFCYILTALCNKKYFINRKELKENV